MFKIKNLFGLLLSGIISVGLVTTSLAATDKVNVENIRLQAENCNVILDISTDGKFQYDYDETVFEITSRTDESTVSITAKLKAKAQLMDTITIHIPDQEYKSITVDSKVAGVTIPTLNTNINVTSDKGAIGIKIPKSFNKTINYKATNSSGRISFNKDTINYTLKMTLQNSSIGLASYFPSYKVGNKNYEYKNGNGNAKINIDVKDSSFAIVSNTDE